MTRTRHVYTTMIAGTLVSALPTFLLCGGPSLAMLITYQVIFSIGEAMWSARFLEYAAELAPEGRVAQYMGLANVPWLVAKSATGLYAGALLHRYVPEHGAIHSRDRMWFIYGMTGLASPIRARARAWLGDERPKNQSLGELTREVEDVRGIRTTLSESRIEARSIDRSIAPAVPFVDGSPSAQSGTVLAGVPSSHIQAPASLSNDKPIHTLPPVIGSSRTTSSRSADDSKCASMPPRAWHCATALSNASG